MQLIFAKECFFECKFCRRRKCFDQNKSKQAKKENTKCGFNSRWTMPTKLCLKDMTRFYSCFDNIFVWTYQAKTQTSNIWWIWPKQKKYWRSSYFDFVSLAYFIVQTSKKSDNANYLSVLCRKLLFLDVIRRAPASPWLTENHSQGFCWRPHWSLSPQTNIGYAEQTEAPKHERGSRGTLARKAREKERKRKREKEKKGEREKKIKKKGKNRHTHTHTHTPHAHTQTNAMAVGESVVGEVVAEEPVALEVVDGMRNGEHAREVRTCTRTRTHAHQQPTNHMEPRDTPPPLAPPTPPPRKDRWRPGVSSGRPRRPVYPGLRAAPGPQALTRVWGAPPPREGVRWRPGSRLGVWVGPPIPREKQKREENDKNQKAQNNAKRMRGRTARQNRRAQEKPAIHRRRDWPTNSKKPPDKTCVCASVSVKTARNTQPVIDKMEGSEQKHSFRRRRDMSMGLQYVWRLCRSLEKPRYSSDS